MPENDLFAQAYAELGSSDRQAGLWARCFSDANGDESKAKAAYLQARVKELTPAQTPRPAMLDEIAKPQPMQHALERFNTPPPEDIKKSSWKLWLYIPLGLFAAFMTLGFFVKTPDYDARTTDKSAIDLCWSEQQRKSLDPATQRFVAGACESMENNFASKYGRRP